MSKQKLTIDIASDSVSKKGLQPEVEVDDHPLTRASHLILTCCMNYVVFLCAK